MAGAEVSGGVGVVRSCFASTKVAEVCGEGTGWVAPFLTNNVQPGTTVSEVRLFRRLICWIVVPYSMAMLQRVCPYFTSWITSPSGRAVLRTTGTEYCERSPDSALCVDQPAQAACVTAAWV